MQLDHLLTRSGLTYPEVSSKVYHDSFCQSGSSLSLPWVIYFEDILFTICIQLLLYSSNLSKKFWTILDRRNNTSSNFVTEVPEIV